MNIAKKVIGDNTITFLWADETETEINIIEFSNDIQNRARLHGFSQKLGDSYSGAVSVEEAQERLQVVLTGLNEGDWNRKGIATGGLWIEAIATVVGISIEAALEKWNEMSEDDKKGVCKHPDVIVARKEIDVARAKVKAEKAEPLNF